MLLLLPSLSLFCGLPPDMFGVFVYVFQVAISLLLLLAFEEVCRSHFMCIRVLNVSGGVSVICYSLSTFPFLPSLFISSLAVQFTCPVPPS